MEHKPLFSALFAVCEDALCSFYLQQGELVLRLMRALSSIQEHGRFLEPLVAGLTATYHHFDLDALVPANGYRSLVKVVHACILHIIQKGRYIATHCNTSYFRAEHNVAEMEAYGSALCQLCTLLCLAQDLMHDNTCGNLFIQADDDLDQILERNCASIPKACFYGRCLGFQFSPTIRPFLHTVVTALVSFGNNYQRHQSGIGVAISSFLSSGKYAIDPELRGTEFEQIIQNLDIKFWKSFWNITENELIANLACMVTNQVEVDRTLSLPPIPFDLPLACNPELLFTVPPPMAHCGPRPVNMRLISYKLRKGQNLLINIRRKPQPSSPWLLLHFHGGGFVSQTSKSHEIYLRSFSQDLDTPILSVDYSLAPESPFPRALEECFYAYCWAIRNCHLLGSTAERVCLVGDSAGGNLCVAVAMLALSQGLRVPDGLVIAYPVTLLTNFISPSRLLTLIDPLLPFCVLSRCLSAYAGEDQQSEKKSEDSSSSLGMVKRETALFLQDVVGGLSTWVQSLLEPQISRAVKAAISEARVTVRTDLLPCSTMDTECAKTQICGTHVSHWRCYCALLVTKEDQLSSSCNYLNEQQSKNPFPKNGSSQKQPKNQPPSDSCCPPQLKKQSFTDSSCQSYLKKQPLSSCQPQQMHQSLTNCFCQNEPKKRLVSKSSQVQLKTKSDRCCFYKSQPKKLPPSGSFGQPQQQNEFVRSFSYQPQPKNQSPVYMSCQTQPKTPALRYSHQIHPKSQFLTYFPCQAQLKTLSLGHSCQRQQKYLSVKNCFFTTQPERQLVGDLFHWPRLENWFPGNSFHPQPKCHSIRYGSCQKELNKEMVSDPKKRSFCNFSWQRRPVEHSPKTFPRKTLPQAETNKHCSPNVNNPYMSPLLAPDNMLRGLPPVHIVASAMDAMLDDSVMLAKRLRSINQPVSLSVVEDVPHGFLSFFKISEETKKGYNICVARIKDVLAA